MRKNISVTNERVLKAMDESENASKLIEIAVLQYLDNLTIDYVTLKEFKETIDDIRKTLEDYNKKVCILNESYTHSKDLIILIAKNLGLI